jgi:hypothetical protein
MDETTTGQLAEPTTEDYHTSWGELRERGIRPPSMQECFVHARTCPRHQRPEERP